MLLPCKPATHEYNLHEPHRCPGCHSIWFCPSDLPPEKAGRCRGYVALTYLPSGTTTCSHCGAVWLNPTARERTRRLKAYRKQAAKKRRKQRIVWRDMGRLTRLNQELGLFDMVDNPLVRE